MRDYGKIHCQFWHSDDVQAMSDNEKLMALYLLTCSHGNIVGVFRLPQEYISADLGWTVDRVSQTLTELFEMGFISLKNDCQWIVINRFLQFNRPENPNQIKSAVTLLTKMPVNIPDVTHPVAYLEDAIERTKSEKEPLEREIERLDEFCRQRGITEDDIETEDVSNPSETVTEPLANPSLTSNSNSNSNSNRSRSSNSRLVSNDTCQADARPVTQSSNTEDIKSVFEHWQARLDHPQAKLDDKRKGYIRKALKSGYTVDQLQRAIDGCANTPHNMGQNDRNQIYDGIHVIFRDADQIDRFIRNADQAPFHQMSKAGRSTQAAADALMDEMFGHTQGTP